MTGKRTLRSWFLSTTAKPIYITIGAMVVMQIVFALYQNRVKTEAVRVSAKNLSNIIAVGLFQQNRLIIETSSAYAMANSGFYRICIFEGNTLLYSIPFSTDGKCTVESRVFLDSFDVLLESLPGYRVQFVSLRFPHYRDSLFLLLVSAFLCFPLYGVLLTLVRKVDAHLITPLKASVENLRAHSSQPKVVGIFDIVELDELMSAYADKIEEIRALTERESAVAREAAVGRIITQLSHDMRAPLGSVEQLLHLPAEALVADQKPRVQESLYRLNHMLDSLRHADLQALVEPRMVFLDLASGLAQIEAKALQRKIALTLQDLCSDQKFAVDHVKFERAWLNLVSNALDAAKSEVQVIARVVDSSLILQVIDDGSGVPAEVLPRLFERGVTFGKSDGTGLGLAYARQIMRGHGGDAVYRRENGLTIFECAIPHAFVEKETDVMVKPLESHTQSNPRLVAICLEPESLARTVQTRLASLKNENFLFSCEYNEADSVVSNDQDILVRAMDEGKEFTQVKVGLSVDEIVDRLTRKFNLS